MKHHLKITILILILFLLAQFFGLAVIYKYIDPEKSLAAGKTEFKQLPIGERPPVEENTSYIPIIIAILFGTVLMLLLLKLKKLDGYGWVGLIILLFFGAINTFKDIWNNLSINNYVSPYIFVLFLEILAIYFIIKHREEFTIMKSWFLIAVIISLFVAINSFLSSSIGLIISLFLAFLFGIWKVFRPNFWIQTLTEIVIYGGLAAIFVPMLNLMSVSILLILIAIYDAYAVWKSKHMITLAKSQAQAKIFAGLLVPYKDGHVLTHKIKQDITPKKHLKIRTAILGGGDIGFPLIFAGVILKEMGLWQSLLIPFFAMLGLAFLLWYGNEHKFYPAMPFIGAGCFLGLAVVWLLGLLI